MEGQQCVVLPQRLQHSLGHEGVLLLFLELADGGMLPQQHGIPLVEGAGGTTQGTGGTSQGTTGWQHGLPPVEGGDHVVTVLIWALPL